MYGKPARKPMAESVTARYAAAEGKTDLAPGIEGLRSMACPRITSETSDKPLVRMSDIRALRFVS